MNILESIADFRIAGFGIIVDAFPYLDLRFNPELDLK